MDNLHPIIKWWLTHKWWPFETRDPWDGHQQSTPVHMFCWSLRRWQCDTRKGGCGSDTTEKKGSFFKTTSQKVCYVLVVTPVGCWSGRQIWKRRTARQCKAWEWKRWGQGRLLCQVLTRQAFGHDKLLLFELVVATGLKGNIDLILNATNMWKSYAL